jgi:hypothetical protein
MRRWMPLVAFGLGVALGVAGALQGRQLAALYLPEAWRGKVESVEGRVVRKQREPDRLLLTLVSERGAILATFTRRIPELDLLIDQGDRVTLSLAEVRPFVENPTIVRVQKEVAPPPAGESQPQPAPAPPATPGGKG